MASEEPRDLAAYGHSTLVGSLRALWRHTHVGSSVHRCWAMAWPPTSIRRENDPYVTKVYENLRKEFGGALPCCFMELLLMSLLSVARKVVADVYQCLADKSFRPVAEADAPRELSRMQAKFQPLIAIHWSIARPALVEKIHQSLAVCQRKEGGNHTCNNSCAGKAAIRRHCVARRYSCRWHGVGQAPRFWCYQCRRSSSCWSSWCSCP